MVYNNSTEFLNGSPSFLTANREKTIQASTVKNNIQDWTKLVENQRRTYAMGPGAFEQLQLILNGSNSRLNSSKCKHKRKSAKKKRGSETNRLAMIPVWLLLSAFLQPPIPPMPSGSALKLLPMLPSPPEVHSQLILLLCSLTTFKFSVGAKVHPTPKSACLHLLPGLQSPRRRGARWTVTWGQHFWNPLNRIAPLRNCRAKQPC